MFIAPNTVLVHEYVHSISDIYPVLVDILVDPGVDHTDAEDKKMGVGFREHWSITSIHDGLRVCLCVKFVLVYC